jgi:hypothetical protein
VRDPPQHIVIESIVIAARLTANNEELADESRAPLLSRLIRATRGVWTASIEFNRNSGISETNPRFASTFVRDDIRGNSVRGYNVTLEQDLFPANFS